MSVTIEVLQLLFGDFILNLALGKLPYVMIFMMMKCSHEYNNIEFCCYMSPLKAF